MSPTKNNALEIGKVDSNLALETTLDDDLHWHPAFTPPFQLLGFPWFDEDKKYRRLPVSPRLAIRDHVDGLANCTAGGQVRFQTNSRRVAVRARLPVSEQMQHMPATGQKGFDLYIQTPAMSEPTFVGGTRCNLQQEKYTALLFEGEETNEEWYTCTINFPLYNAVHEVLIGIEENATIKAPPPFYRPGRVIVYGTSVTQGACASRPGMAFTNILSRRLNLEFVNLGFSGNGRGESELAHLIGDIPEPLLYVLDYEANCQGIQTFRETLPAFIAILRERQPQIPVLLVSRFTCVLERINPQKRDEADIRREFQRETIANLRAAGDINVSFLDGSTLLGKDYDECTVDGGHPTDLGFSRLAEGLAPRLREILAPSSSR